MDIDISCQFIDVLAVKCQLEFPAFIEAQVQRNQWGENRGAVGWEILWADVKQGPR